MEESVIFGRNTSIYSPCQREKLPRQQCILEQYSSDPLHTELSQVVPSLQTLTSTVLRDIFIFILLIICRFYAPLETHVGIKIE